VSQSCRFCLPITCQVGGGQRADDGLYRPAYAAVTETLGTRAVLVVGDSKMGSLATRGTIMAQGSCYLCPICTKIRRRVSLWLFKTRKGYPSPMTTITELAATMQTLLTSTANELAKKQALSSGSAK